MKKIIILLSLVLILTSCNMMFYNNEGFTIYGLGAVMERNQVLIQSRDGYITDNNIYNEAVFYNKVTVFNKLNRDIELKLTTYKGKEEYITQPAKSRIKLTYIDGNWECAIL